MMCKQHSGVIMLNRDGVLVCDECKGETKSILSDEQRKAIKQYIFDSCMGCMFGDGMEADYINSGFPAFKGINNMTDAELLEEAGCLSDPEAIAQFLKEL